MPRTTHTYALLEVSPMTYAEIAKKLRDAGCDAEDEGTVNMHGIGITPAEVAPAEDGEIERTQALLAELGYTYGRDATENVLLGMRLAAAGVA